ncbi:unnamed protein product [Schistosoma rodhaini]|uniref:Ribonucleases P/MRP protein subunit POP1 n=1 Tax=Schistosoma rodhaini TaxID=6188 RepID=A0A183QDR7_9TREM|nr:unnamed protein product [Schistosoma rodhaini]
MNFKSISDLPESTYSQYACFDVLRLATVRGAELASFESSINILTSTALTGLQRLPVRLRRRAASHRINRLPRRFHKHHHLTNPNENGSKSGTFQIKNKLKSRRYRRRTLRLLAMHARFVITNKHDNHLKKEKSFWLPTHIWHAKRFHMITKWGWRLPYAPTNKIFKACHKASHNGCLLFDFSYLNCFQIYGPENMLVKCLNDIFQLDYHVDSWLPELSNIKTPLWSCEQTGILYATNKYVKNISRPVLGPVRILWGSLNSLNEGFRHIWLWLHPAMSASAWDLLQTSIKEVNSLNDTQCALELDDVTGYFCRLRLIGRQSHGLISDIIQLKNGNALDENWTSWNNLSTNIREAACVPSGLVISLQDCENFRSNRPRLKIRNRNWSIMPIKLCDNNPNNQHQPSTVESLDNKSGFVLPSGKQLSWLDINKFYPNHTNPPDQLLSTKINLETKENSIDVVLVQNSTPSLIRSSPETVGWDVILRRNFPQSKNDLLLRGSLTARDFLIACVYRGAEVGGLRDLYYWAGLGTRAGGRFDSFPETLWPDTVAGQKSAEIVTKEKLNKFIRLPSNLRPDFTKFGITHPFVYPWSELIAQNSISVGKTTDPVISSTISNNDNAITSSSDDNNNKWFVLREPGLLRLVVHRMLVGENRAKLSLQQLYNYNSALLNAIILVYLKTEHRGVPQAYARIYAFYPNESSKGNSRKGNSNLVINSANGKKSFQPSHCLLIGYVQDGGYGQSIGRGIGLGFISLSALSNALNLINTNKRIKYCIQNPTSHESYTVRLSVVI